MREVPVFALLMLLASVAYAAYQRGKYIGLTRSLKLVESWKEYSEELQKRLEEKDPK